MHSAQWLDRATHLATCPILVAVLIAAGCSGKEDAPKPGATAPAVTVSAPVEQPLPPPTDIAVSLPEGIRAELNRPF